MAHSSRSIQLRLSYSSTPQAEHYRTMALHHPQIEPPTPLNDRNSTIEPQRMLRHQFTGDLSLALGRGSE
ncbi:hypothetical protein N7494_004753 [Penicillium frequentans]|uniref:Uncharacterized protein n=1 Tax=Penicillium frequentans TaxID=3151616 RepID=A0AAD6GJ77_9EURO|nr:hypothetical protein N7494_004753 [Penicillium glabrum]